MAAAAGEISLVTAGEKGAEVGQELRLVIPGSVLVSQIIISDSFTKCSSCRQGLQNRGLGSGSPETRREGKGKIREWTYIVNMIDEIQNIFIKALIDLAAGTVWIQQ